MTKRPTTTLSRLDKAIAARGAGDVPACSFVEFLGQHARVRSRSGAYVPFGFEGRNPLRFAAELIDKIVRNTKGRESVEIDGVTYAPGSLKGSTVSLCGGAQFGKTVLELNLGGYLTTCQFLNFGYYTSDRELLATIVDTKFRPDVVDQIPWMQRLIQLDKAESKSGKSVNRKNAFQVSDGDRKAFGYFNGMQKPPTTITLDVAALDEVDDIPERNIGFVSGRMTNSDVQLTCFIGTQRVHAAGQNARWAAGTMHTWMIACPGCKVDVNLEDNWPGCCRVPLESSPNDPQLNEAMAFDPEAKYYAACPHCGTPLHPETGRFVAKRPEQARQRNWSIRISQMDIPAIPWRDIVAAWFAALNDPNPEALAAWHCDRRAIPHAGASQPITPETISSCVTIGIANTLEDGEHKGTYSMNLVNSETGRASRRVAGMDMGPRCWLWINEIVSPVISACAWAEMVPSGRAAERCAQLLAIGAFDCIFLDAGGEPDLTKQIVMSLNGLAEWRPPAMTASELQSTSFSWPGGLAWNPSLGQWRGLRAAAVEFSLRDAGGIVQCLGRTQEGRIYPLIKCNRGESIQGFVNDFLGPAQGVIQQVEKFGLRRLPRQRLPSNSIGSGVSGAMLANHLQNLRKVRSANGGAEDWADGVENHLGLAGCYARLASMVSGNAAGGNCGVGRKQDREAGQASSFDRRQMVVPNSSRRIR